MIWRATSSPPIELNADECQVAGQPGVGPVPAGQIDHVRVDLLHVDDVGVFGQVQVARLTAAEHQHPHVELPGGLEVARIGDDLRHRAQSGGGGQIAVGRHQHRHRAEARERGDRDERAGPGLHQHADVGALPHADLDQAAHHVVDAAVDRLVGVHPAVEQQRLPVRAGRGPART